MVVTIALLGLITLQSFWIKNAIEIKEMQFDQQVHSALMSIVKSLQQEEAVHQLAYELDSTNESVIKKITRTQEPSDEASKKSIYVSKEIYLSNQVQNKVSAKIAVVPSDSIPDDLTSELKKGNSNEEFLYSRSVHNKRKFVENIVNKLIRPHLKLEEKISKNTLERIIKAEMSLSGINIPYEYIVKDERGNAIFKTDSFNESKNIEHYYVRLYPDEIFTQPYFLTVDFPGQETYILRSISFIIISSVLLTTIIIIVIGVAFYIIFKQKRLSEVKTDFINNMTHELKTPISTISLASQLLGDTSVPLENKNVEYLSKVVNDESKRLGQLVEKVLQMAVFDQTQLKLKFKKVNLHEIIEAIIRNFTINIKNRNGKIFHELNAENVTIYADEVHITNVIINLLENALKYCTDEPVIIISTQNTGFGIAIDVKDNGIGINKESQKKIFEQFYRVPTGNIHNVRGFGLGLSYVKKIAEAHNGFVAVDSKPGQGSTFTINLPLNNEG